MKQAFPPIIGPDSTTLFLGTMPGEKSLQLQQYYGNRGNQFWKLLFEVLGEEFTDDYDKRLQIVLRHKLALWDVLQYCERDGSLDSNIKNEEANDFEAFFSKYPNIQVILFTSKNAAAYYDRYVGRRHDLRYEVLPSPSGANASMRFEQKLLVWREKILPLISF